MFGLFKKKIPASMQERALLVEQLFLMRCETDPEYAAQFTMMFGVRPDCISGDRLMTMGAPEYTLLSVVEQYLHLKDRGATDEYAIKVLNKNHTSHLSLVGEELEILNQASDLFRYSQHILQALHGLSVSEHFLIDAIQYVKTYYKR